uniref:F-box/SPRY domain-containing protein 1 n=1 Tax=Plectus sambesii TaxID=2011161 RepID=A0A914VTC8_9BILA
MAGETSRSRPVSAARLPHHVLARLFQYLSIKDLAACRRVCRHWMAYLEYEDCEVWETLCRREVPDSALSDPYLLCEVPTFLAKLRAFKHAWNSRDASRNVYVRSNGFTVHRNPIAQSTDGIRGKMGVSTGYHAWELAWEGPLGTVAVVGLATRHAALQCPGYVPLLGSDDQSWGWNLVDNALLHNGDCRQPYPHVNNPPKYQVGERIRMVLDCEEHVVYFEKGCEFLGVAFKDLPPVKLFPAVCAVYGNTEVSMIYLGPPLLG